MNKLFVVIGLIAALGCKAQDAKIMILERQDTWQLADAYKEYKAAQKRWEDLKTKIASKYTTDAPDGAPGGKPIPGWEKIQFSADFRAMVPDSSPYASHPYSCWGSILTTNASSAAPLDGALTLSGSPTTRAVGTYNNGVVIGSGADFSTSTVGDGVNSHLTTK